MMIAKERSEPAEVAENAKDRRARRVSSYPAGYQRTVHELAASSPAVEDLADSFPALLFALATGHATAEKRTACLETVVSGGSLRSAADVLGLPHWLRKLPAHAFAGPLVTFPSDAQFGLRMASLVPASAPMTAEWLMLVSEAIVGNGPEYALWIARFGHAVSRHLTPGQRRLMAAWSWFSLHPECDAAHLLRKRWTPDIAPRRALEEFQAWRERLALADWLGSGQLEPWITGGSALGYTFEPLRTAPEFIALGHSLDNCLDQYATQMRLGISTVAAVRKADRILACVEVGLNESEPTMPSIIQLRGYKNRRASPEIWQAAFAWLGSQAIEPFSADRLMPPSADRTRSRRALWKPYFDFLENQGANAACAPEIKQQIRRIVVSKTGRAFSTGRLPRNHRSPLAARRTIFRSTTQRTW
jgi:hypothetical protein